MKIMKMMNLKEFFFIFTNGFDEELVLHEQLQKKIFNNSNNSFVFIFSKAEGIKDEHSKKLTKSYSLLFFVMYIFVILITTMLVLSGFVGIMNALK